MWLVLLILQSNKAGVATQKANIVPSLSTTRDTRFLSVSGRPNVMVRSKVSLRSVMKVRRTLTNSVSSREGMLTMVSVPEKRSAVEKTTCVDSSMTQSFLDIDGLWKEDCERNC